MATTGAASVTIDGRRYPGWSGFVVRAGAVLSLDELEGARAYLAIQGGIDVPPVLGSRSTDLESGFGGHQGRRLVRGDRLRIGVGTRHMAPGMRLRHPSPPAVQHPLLTRVVLGPRAQEFSRQARSTLLSAGYRMSPRSNHIGIRLDGPAIEAAPRGSRVSEPMPVGGIQVTPAGQPVILLNARGTIGGYALIATVVSSDVWKLGQLRPGDTVRFEDVSLAEAREIGLDAYRELQGTEPVAET